MSQYFVTGIGTEVGKTVVSAILVKLLNAYYWKPIQTGCVEYSDSKEIARLIENDEKIIPSLYNYDLPLSPHIASQNLIKPSINGILKNYPIQKNIIIEGIGGVMVPLNWSETILDLIKTLGMEVIIVSKHYLGSINHSILSIVQLLDADIKIKGIVFVGDDVFGAEDAIIKFTKIRKIISIPITKNINSRFVENQAIRVKYEL